jgi:hypothetical protein
MDIKETKELVGFGLHLASAIKDAMDDGKMNILDFPKFFKVLKKLKPALDGIEMIPSELKDLDDAEKAELMAAFQDKFDIGNADLEAKIEMALDASLSLLRLVLDFKKK